MKFGSKEAYELIAEYLEKGDEKARDELIKILYSDAREVISKYFNGLVEEDKEDIIQDSVFTVLKRLPKLYMIFSDYTAGERCSWLRRVVLTRKYDYQQSKKATIVAFEDDIEIRNDGVDETCSELREEVMHALGDVFSINTSAEKLIAFMYNRVMGKIIKKNSTPKEIVKDFYGEDIEIVYESMVNDLNKLFDVGVSHDVLEDIESKVRNSKNRTFSLNEKGISDSSNIILNKMKAKKEAERK